jgi:Flp pilus assembly protein TadB
MLRLALVTTVAVALATAMATTAAAATTARGVAPAASVARPAPVFAAFRSFGFGSRSRFGFGSRRRYGYGYGRRSPSLLHRVVKTAIWLYILHLFFTHGGLSILLWIIIIGFVLSLVRRRRRYGRRAQSFWP